MGSLEKDWLDWHRQYEDASSPLSQRLEVVQQILEDSLTALGGRSATLVSVCAGQGHDVIGVLSRNRSIVGVRATLIENDPRNVEIARKAIAEEGLADVEVVEADAGRLAVYEGLVPADIVLLCGVFGNVPERDIFGTVDVLPQLVTEGGRVVWTRTRREPDLTPRIRRYLLERSFAEESFVAPQGELWSVGLNRYDGDAKPLRPSMRMFEFTRASGD